MKPIILLLIILAIVSTFSNIFNGINFGSGTLGNTSAFTKVIGNMLQEALNLAFFLLNLKERKIRDYFSCFTI